jgi:hypothetical protein
MEWCRTSLDSSERESLRRRLSDVVGKTSDTKKSREMLRRSDGGSGFCEPFWFYPRLFTRIVTAAPKDVEREDVVEVMSAFSFNDLNLFTPATGSEEYTRRIGDIVLSVEVDQSLVRGYTITQTDRFGDSSVKKRWPTNNRRQRMLVKAVLTYFQENRATAIDFEMSNGGGLMHSRGWSKLVSQILRKRIPIYARYEYTAAGNISCFDQLRFYV